MDVMNARAVAHNQGGNLRVVLDRAHSVRGRKPSAASTIAEGTNDDRLLAIVAEEIAAAL